MRIIIPALLCAIIACTACSNDSEDSAGSGGSGSEGGSSSSGGEGNSGDCETAAQGFDADYFAVGSLVGEITEEDCTLGDGSETSCYRIEIAGAPANHDVGPFCPRSIADGPEAGGIWLDSGKVFDVDGEFIVGLAEYYDDDVWQLYDVDSGLVNVTDTQESCDAAARPDVDAAYNNYCVECLLEYVDGGVPVEILIPVNPVPRETASELGMSAPGVALSGVRFDAPAPTDAILAAHTIAAFDDCGGHVNLNAGYHYHAATGCSPEVEQCDGHSPLIGFAMDGYGIHTATDENGDEPTDLDECRGHTDKLRGYHYHSASAGENMFIGCFHGEIVGGTTEGPGGPGGPGGPPPE